MQYNSTDSSYSSSFSSSSSSVGSFLRQLSNSSKYPCSRGGSASKRWSSVCSMRKQQQQQHSTDDHHQPPPMDHYHSSNLYVEGLNKLCHQHDHDHDQDHYNYVVKKKRVMVVVDSSTRSKQAMMWALTHVSNKGDLLTLLHIIPTPNTTSSSSVLINGGGSSSLAASLASLCKACKPEVEIEGLVIEGPKLVGTVLSQVKKLDVSVLVLGQKKPSPLSWLFQCGGGSRRNDGLGDEFVEECIKSAECLALGVRKQSKGVGGYLISTRWQKNFWLLA